MKRRRELQRIKKMQGIILSEFLIALLWNFGNPSFFKGNAIAFLSWFFLKIFPWFCSKFLSAFVAAFLAELLNWHLKGFRMELLQEFYLELQPRFYDFPLSFFSLELLSYFFSGFLPHFFLKIRDLTRCFTRSCSRCSLQDFGNPMINISEINYGNNPEIYELFFLFGFCIQ